MSLSRLDQVRGMRKESPSRHSSRSSSPSRSEIMHRSRHKQKKTEDTGHEVEVIHEDQMHNPYSLIQLFTGHTDMVRILLNIDDGRCVSAADDCLAIVWDIESGLKLFTLQHHTRPVTSMCLLEANKETKENMYLLTAGSDKQLCIWSLDNGSLKHCFKAQGSVKSLVSFQSLGLFCSGGDKLSIWDRSSGKLLQEYSTGAEEDIHLMLVARQDRLVVVVDKQIIVYTPVQAEDSDTQDWEMKQLKKLPPHRESIGCLCKVSEASFTSASLDGTIILWATQSMTPCRYFNSIQEYEGPNKTYPFSVQHMIATGDRYLVAAVGSGFCMYDTMSGRCVAEKVNCHYSKILHLQFVNKGRLLATCSEDGSIRLWGFSKCNENGYDCNTVVEKFLCTSQEKLKQMNLDDPAKKPQLLGECLGHSGAVQMCKDFGDEGIVSCGVDGLVIAWKEEWHQRKKTFNLIRDMNNHSIS